MNLDWNDLHYFVLLVEKETLTAAANALDVEHGTVSRRIERLEKQLGLHLFNRINKRYLLTDDGRDLYAEAKKLQLNIKQFAQTAQDKCQSMGEVTVSAPPFVANSLITPLLAHFYRRFRHIRLILNSDSGLSNLHRSQADIALRIAQPKQDDLVAHRLMNVEYRWFAHRDYLACTPESERQFLSLNLTGTHQQWLQTQLTGKSVRFACNDFNIMKSAVLQQLGVGLLPVCYIDSPDLAAVKNMEYFRAPLYLVMHEDVRQSQKVRMAADFLIENLRD
ncbi:MULTISPECIES: LysR family transcriptional regulator [Pasteurellaceae]|uniref:LysR protein n=1 Tax=Mannheimia succiniciproducens (strain KCTC 0769BP / MBEL55E) TaxID=221988 RepID=Q65QZ7_MANSM|nr:MULTISPECIES: LysR family transcriptional regulator [Pasteurellaceae]AAU38613.1 LysR protein [[Mannheimia] succiniciproducens MBEL55E]WGE85342.1 LysR family transcriptional regulator [Actinobacillus equuli subsp. haemolyticus]